MRLQSFASLLAPLDALERAARASGKLPLALAALCTALACAGAQRLESSTAATASAPVEPLAALNAEVRADYAEARARALAAAGPILIAGPDKLKLLRGGAREEAPLDPPGYHELKAVAHVPLGLHALLAEGALDDARVAALRRLRSAIEAAAAALPSASFSEAQLVRQRRIIAASLALLDGAAEHRSAEGLAAFEQSVAPLLLENARDAARAQLELIHRTVTAFRARMGPREWSSLHVVIVGAHMARDRQIALQYFQRLFNEPEGGRIIYAEGLWREQDALALLATHLIDAGAGAGFFGEPLRMHRDLLADAAAEYLPQLLP
jgi:hypothetical protein